MKKISSLVLATMAGVVKIILSILKYTYATIFSIIRQLWENLNGTLTSSNSLFSLIGTILIGAQQVLLFCLDSVISFFLYFIQAFGLGRPGVLGTLRFIFIFGAAFLFAIKTNQYLTQKWSEIERLQTPIIIENGSQKVGNYLVSYGFDIGAMGTSESYFRVSSKKEKLFELTLLAKRQIVDRNSILDPISCSSIKINLPTKKRRAIIAKQENVAISVDTTQPIYQVCEFTWPFISVFEASVSLDRQSLIELLRHEFDAAVEATSTGDKGDVSSGDADKSKSLTLSDLTVEQRLLIKDNLIGLFLRAAGILGQSSKSKESSSPVELVCPEGNSLQSSVCRSLVQHSDLLFSHLGEGSFQTDDRRCGQDDSILDRICDSQSAMFTNGRIQFISLLVFCYGFLHLSIIFLIGVFAPAWLYFVEAWSSLWIKKNATVEKNKATTLVDKIVKLPRFTKLYHDLLAPVMASVEMLPMIGFFGTIVGISGAMTEVAGVKSSDKTVEVLSLGSMTTNIGVAFETTKYALILSAILLALKLLVDRAQALLAEKD